MPRSIVHQLEHDLHCAIETGNLEEGRLVIVQAESAFEEKIISSDELAQLAYDFCIFQDSIC